MSSKKVAKYKVEITRTAETDMEEIRSYLTEDGQEATTGFILALERQTETLESFPERSPLIPENELLSAQYRHLIHGPYRTIYRISGKSVFVLRIVNGARLLEMDQ